MTVPYFENDVCDTQDCVDFVLLNLVTYLLHILQPNELTIYMLFRPRRGIPSLCPTKCPCKIAIPLVKAHFRYITVPNLIFFMGQSG